MPVRVADGAEEWLLERDSDAGICHSKFRTALGAVIVRNGAKALAIGFIRGQVCKSCSKRNYRNIQ